jgi:hypothetical protein
VRPALALALAAVLAGCSSPDAAPPAGPPAAWVTPDAVVLVDGVFTWHDTGLPGPPNVMETFDLASQAVAHPCVWEGTGSPEPYFNNLRLPTAQSPYPAWSGNLSVTLDWTDADWVGTRLRIAYQGPATEEWQESEPIGRGTAAAIPVRHTPTGNATGEDAGPGWSVWVCLPTDSGTLESPFLGDVAARVAFRPDPMPAALLEPAGRESGRTGRSA